MTSWSTKKLALKASELQKIPQRNKDLIFGYAKECEKEHQYTIPSMIKYLCLVYLNQNKDGFDFQKKHFTLRIDKGCITCCGRVCLGSSLLQNTVDSGINIWTFKVQNEFQGIRIGIQRHDAEFRGNTWFDEGLNQECIGYGFMGGGYGPTPRSCTNHGIIYGPKWIENDIIEMKFDCTKWTLLYKINDVDYGKVFNIEQNKYRAAITFDFFSVGASVTLISYQHIF